MSISRTPEVAKYKNVSQVLIARYIIHRHEAGFKNIGKGVQTEDDATLWVSERE
jgi:hypothetical protein